REILGADYHDRIVDAESVSKEEFSRIVAKNDDLCRRLNLQYLWSVLLVNGRVVFTSATHSDLNNPDSSCASFFETHRDPEAFTPALQPELKPAFCSFKNEWGEGRQVLIPHKDARGRTYIFGASVQMDDLNAVVSQTILDSIGIGFGILCGALLLALMLVRSFPKPIAELTAAAGRMATGDLDVSLPLARISELQSLSRSLDEMRQGLKKQLAQLLESEKNYRELVENANSIILRLEPDGTITFFNDFAEKFFGFSKNEILGKAVFGTIVPETDSTNRDLRAMVLDIARNPEKYAKNETENMCKDGSRVWISWSNKAICDAAGTVCEILCVGNDVTERKRAVEALAKEREDLLAVFDALPEFVYLQAPDYSIRYANHSFKQLFGEPGDRFCYACMQNRQSPCETCPTFEVFQTKQPQCWEWAADNQVYMIHVVPFADIDGSMLVLAIGFDITDLKRAEEALIRSEAMLAQSQQIANIGSWDLDVAANRLIWSDETYRIFGLAPQEFVATYETFLDLVHPDDRAMVDEMYSRSLHEGLDSYEIEHRLVRRSTGEIRHVHEKCVHQRNAAGEVIRSRGMVQDITERKRAQEALIESEERFKNMFELHGSIMLLIDPESGFVVDANEAAVSYYGYSKSKLITMKIDEINVLSPQQVKAELELALHEERNYFIFQHRLASGEERTVEVHSWPIIFMDRQIRFSIIHDITERRLAP
ncbi:MAG: PAS domain S-box protein, partial [Kiritimatiellaceae bacterium]|nr:PAS domain S-box protein [Kiritimatiellaceae bacterium]